MAAALRDARGADDSPVATIGRHVGLHHLVEFLPTLAGSGAFEQRVGAVVVDELLPFPIEIQFLIQRLANNAEHQCLGQVTGNTEGRESLVLAFASGSKASTVVELRPVGPQGLGVLLAVFGVGRHDVGTAAVGAARQSVFSIRPMQERARPAQSRGLAAGIILLGHLRVIAAAIAPGEFHGRQFFAARGELHLDVRAEWEDHVVVVFH